MMTCIDAFGPGRCMFESNFPVDKAVFVRERLECVQAADRAGEPDERDALFRGTVTHAYRLG